MRKCLSSSHIFAHTHHTFCLLPSSPFSFCFCSAVRAPTKRLLYANNECRVLLGCGTVPFPTLDVAQLITIPRSLHPTSPVPTPANYSLPNSCNKKAQCHADSFKFTPFWFLHYAHAYPSIHPLEVVLLQVTATFTPPSLSVSPLPFLLCSALLPPPTPLFPIYVSLTKLVCPYECDKSVLTK